MDLRRTGYEKVESIQMARDRVQWRVDLFTVMDLQVPQEVENFLRS